MKNKIEKGQDKVLHQSQLKVFLVAHLNRIYCAKAHLQEGLPELAEQADLKEFQLAILQTWRDISKQIARLEEIFILLDEEPSLAGCNQLIDFVENEFTPIHQNRSEPEMRDLSIFYYMSIIESVELASFQLLELVAVRMPDKPIRQLLQENFDESKADRSLFTRIATKYIS